MKGKGEMKKFLFTVACCIIVLLNMSVVTSAATTVASGTCGTNVNWVLDSDGLLSISGSGNMSNYTQISGRGAPWYSRASSVKKVSR